MPRAGFTADEYSAVGLRQLQYDLPCTVFHAVDAQHYATAWHQQTAADCYPAVSAQCHLRDFGRLTGARRGEVADERMVGCVEEFDRRRVGQKNVAADRKGRLITPCAALALQCCEQRSFVRASALQEQLLDFGRRAADVGSEQRISLARQAGDTEDALEAAGVRIDDRLAVAAEAV